MFDTSVLSHLVSAEPQRGTTEHDFWMAARMITAQVDELYVSAIVHYELHDATKPDGTTLADAIAKVVQLDVRPIDLAVMDKAGEILNKARQEFEACPRCRAWDGEVVCKKCGRLGPKQFKKNDAIVAAHAHCIQSVEALFTFDGPMLKLDKFVRAELSIQEPPHPAGELWEDAKRKKQSASAEGT